MSTCQELRDRYRAFRARSLADVRLLSLMLERARKRAAGKSKMNALGQCISRGLNLVWGVWRNRQDFDLKGGSELEKTCGI